MELRHLRYFVAVAEEQSVTRAAAKLHVSQPPLSRQIRSLEDELGVVLFHRRTNSVRLNDAGHKFRPLAIAILQHVDRVAKGMADYRQNHFTKVRIGYSGLASSDILPVLLRRFKEEVPQGAVELIEMSSQKSITAVKNAELDLALTVRSRIALPGRLRFDALRTYKAGIFVSKKHPLASVKGVSLCDVLGQPLVSFSKKDYANYHHFLRSVFRGARSTPHIVQECDGAESLLAAISSGYGIAIMFALPARLRPGIGFVPFKHGVEPMTVGLLYRDEDHAPRIASFIRAARSLQAKRLASTAL